MPSWHVSAIPCKGLPAVQALLQADVQLRDVRCRVGEGSDQHCSRCNLRLRDAACNLSTLKHTALVSDEGI